MAIASFFLLHWWGSVFFQTFYHHRYASHRMFTMGKRTERVMHLLAYIFQGSSYLDVRAYAVLHREHHAFSDTERDPHSPMHHKNALTMMLATNERYQGYAQRKVDPEPRFASGIPEWALLDRLGRSWTARFVWMGIYTAFYAVFATAWWQYLLLPVHFVMGPVHGAIVNWCGHKNGYRNYASKDNSRNTLPFDFVTLGELFQNNHHHASRTPNFARRWFEIDPTYQVMRVMAKLGIIRFVVQPKGVVEDGDGEVAEPTELRQAS